MRQLRFEAIKMLSNKKNLLLLTMVLLVIIGFGWLLPKNLETEKSRLKGMDTVRYLQLAQSHSLESDKQLEKYYKSAMDSLDSYWKYSEIGDWYSALTSQNEYIHSLNKIKENNGNIPRQTINLDEQELENTYLLENDIQPENVIFGLSATYYVRVVLKIVFSIISSIVIILMLFDLFSSEFEMNTIRLLYLLPFSRKKILRVKKNMAYLLFGSFFVVIVVVSYLTGLLVSGKSGSWEYPVGISSAAFLPLWRYLLVGSILFVGGIIWQLFIIQYISLILRQSEKVLFSSLVVISLPGGLISQMSVLGKGFNYVPWYYLNINQIILTNSNNLELLIIQLLVSTIIVIILNKLIESFGGKLFEIRT